MACGSKTPATCTTNADCSGSTSFCNANSSCVSPPERLVFVTRRFGLPGASYATPASLDNTFRFNSVADADKACAEEAIVANRKPQSPKGTFMAYLTTGSATVLSRITPHIFPGDSRAVYQPGNLSNNPLLTHQDSVLTMIPNAVLQAPLSRDTLGEVIPNTLTNFWVGDAPNNCSNWTASTAAFSGASGAVNKKDNWTEVGNLQCNFQIAPLVCIEVDQ